MLRMIPCGEEWMRDSKRSHAQQESFLIPFYLEGPFCRLHVPFPDCLNKVRSMSSILFQLHLREQKVEWASLGYVFRFEVVLECLGDCIAKTAGS